MHLLAAAIFPTPTATAVAPALAAAAAVAATVVLESGEIEKSKKEPQTSSIVGVAAGGGGVDNDAASLLAAALGSSKPKPKPQPVARVAAKPARPGGTSPAHVQGGAAAERKALPPRPFKRCRVVSSTYDLLEKVGQGTFGEVHKARLKAAPHDIVALKKVLMQNEREGFPITALREIKILMLLDHPNILRLKEICHEGGGGGAVDRTQGSISLVFEFMEHDLGGLLNRQVDFKPAEIICISKQMFEGLHYCHKNKILHRDMKVANLLLSNKGVLKIADFGLARGYDSKNSKYTRTVCTRWYRPPEVLLGLRNYSTAIDVWGAGCIVAELFIGRPILRGGIDLHANPKCIHCQHQRRPNCNECITLIESANDLDQYLEICKLCGTPSEEIWPGFNELPFSNFARPKETYVQSIKKKFERKMKGVKSAIPFIEKLLTLDPEKRLAAEKALDDVFFWGGVNGQDPMPCEPDQIRKFPSSHEWLVQKPAVSAVPPQHHGSKHNQQHNHQHRPGTRPGGGGGGNSYRAQAGGSGRGGSGGGSWGGRKPLHPGAGGAGSRFQRGGGGGYQRAGPSSYARQGGGGGGGGARPSVWAKKTQEQPAGGAKPSVWAKKLGGVGAGAGAGGGTKNPSVWASKKANPGSVANAASGIKRKWGAGSSASSSRASPQPYADSKRPRKP